MRAMRGEAFVSEHSNMAPTTQWERAGFGWWRWLRGVKLTVTERTRTAEVDGRHLSSSAPVMWCADLDTEDAQAWCEGWALRVASLFPGRATEAGNDRPWRTVGAGEAREGGDAMDASERARLRALHEMDAARIAALETALREAYEAHRSCYGRALWCGRCGAEWGTQHIGDCPVGRALRVLDGGER